MISKGCLVRLDGKFFDLGGLSRKSIFLTISDSYNCGGIHDVVDVLTPIGLKVVEICFLKKVQ